MNNLRVWYCLVILILSSAIVFAQNQGSKEIIINGGKMGNITFPHYTHHGVIQDCMVCHAAFSKEPGALQKAKDLGTLYKKQVMKESCLKCHLDKKKAGETFGPVKCKGCHVK
ncbi:MAG: cytochrome c3 family protein [Desulfobacula sp.]|jgi:hypothetical protein|nr:cytochrome c3 family protein [Desulfobacula sp.]MBT7260749.1 cytochrome c3 family protein [Desulfobacula sp.]